MSAKRAGRVGFAHLDNYAAEKRLAAQLEAEWGDALMSDVLESEIAPARRLGFHEYVGGPFYYGMVADWLASLLIDEPGIRRVADIGGGLGRFLYEFVGRLPGIDQAIYVEPSPTLFRWGSEILGESRVSRVPFLKGLVEVEWRNESASLALDPERTRRIRMVHGSVDTVASNDRPVDVAIALNVLDECAYPAQMANRIIELAAPTGYVVFACAHQFQERFYIDRDEVFDSLHDLFPDCDWRLVSEIELPYTFRTGERHWNRFLSHHVLYQRVPWPP